MWLLNGSGPSAFWKSTNQGLYFPESGLHSCYRDTNGVDQSVKGLLVAQHFEPHISTQVRRQAHRACDFTSQKL
ncbi:hypothetical protein MKW98_004272, partial [Papaver atlanticum]